MWSGTSFVRLRKLLVSSFRILRGFLTEFFFLLDMKRSATMLFLGAFSVSVGGKVSH